MRRRDFIAALGSAPAWTMAARAQQLPVIGFLNAGTADRFANELRWFHEGLNETGFVEDRNVGVEYRYAEGQYDRLPGLAADLVRRKVSVIVATGSTASGLAAKAATSTIPIIYAGAADPVAAGLVTSLNRPDGNVTGVSSLSAELVPKRLELLHEAVPTATVIAALINPSRFNSASSLQALQTAAQKLGVRLQVAHADSERDFEAAFASLAKVHAPLLISTDALFLDRRDQLGALALQHAIPAIYSYREFAVAGGLMSYGANRKQATKLVGAYTGRILKGEKPADLPIQQPTEFEFVVNLKVAKALGVNVPLPLLASADEVIE